MKTNLFAEIKAAGIPCHNHESDLYLPDTAEVWRILEKFPGHRANARRFFNRVEKETWLDVPFAFQPWWDIRAGKAKP